jgi:hypothetical protein
VRADVAELLPELALGLLPADELAAIERAVAASPELQREVAEMTEALAVPAAALPPAVPPAALRARLLATLGGPDRFRPFFAELARRFDLTVEAVRALLGRIDDPAAWEATPVPWVKLIHFQGGPALGAADAGFVRVGAGRRFPRHSHKGPEMSFVLEGRMIEGTRVYRPGELEEISPDVVHDYVAGPEADLVVMVWHHGIVLVGD